MLFPACALARPSPKALIPAFKASLFFTNSDVPSFNALLTPAVYLLIPALNAWAPLSNWLIPLANVGVALPKVPTPVFNW